MDRSLLPAEVGEDEERVYKVAGEAYAGQRNPDTQGHEGLDKACKHPEVNANDSYYTGSICLSDDAHFTSITILAGQDDPGHSENPKTSVEPLVERVRHG